MQLSDTSTGTDILKMIAMHVQTLSDSVKDVDLISLYQSQIIQLVDSAIVVDEMQIRHSQVVSLVDVSMPTDAEIINMQYHRLLADIITDADNIVESTVHVLLDTIQQDVQPWIY